MWALEEARLPDREIIGQRYSDILDRDSGRIIADLSLRRCVFENCHLSEATSPGTRTIVRKVVLSECAAKRCTVGPSVLDEVTIDGLRTAGLLQCWGTVFRRVTLRGRIGRLMISTLLSASGSVSVAEVEAFRAANEPWIQATDWALDISRASFEECDIRGIPSRFIRRDPDTQLVVRRERLVDGAWRALPLEGTYWPTILDNAIRTGMDDVVLVAPRPNRVFPRMLEGLQVLKHAGVAEA